VECALLRPADLLHPTSRVAARERWASSAATGGRKAGSFYCRDLSVHVNRRLAAGALHPYVERG
jgi:hypothetical protein